MQRVLCFVLAGSLFAGCAARNYMSKELEFHTAYVDLKTDTVYLDLKYNGEGLDIVDTNASHGINPHIEVIADDVDTNIPYVSDMLSSDVSVRRVLPRNSKEFKQYEAVWKLLKVK